MQEEGKDKMKESVCGAGQCTGCMACIAKCPKSAITIEDSLDSYTARIDGDRCINCGVCEDVCQIKRPIAFKEAFFWKQGWAAKMDIRENSSSGGAAAALIQQFIEDGGVVYSCVFRNGLFVFDCADTREKALKFVGSKYVKSNPQMVYREIQNKLENGMSVLFLGLPCQVAGLLLFVSDRWKEKLYTIDLICHGSPSPKLFDQYMREHGVDISEIEDIRFRKKDDFRLWDNGYIPITSPDIFNRYLHSFLQCIVFTENCYSCKFARRERISDITLGDSWGSELSEEERKKGISLIIVSTVKGHKIVEKTDIILFDVNQVRAMKANPQLVEPAKKTEKRSIFFESIKKGKRYDRAVFDCYPKLCLKQDLKYILTKFHVLRGNRIDYFLSYKCVNEKMDESSREI